MLRATWWISTLPATQVTPRRLSSGLVAAMSSAIMSSIPVSTSRISGRGAGCAGRRRRPSAAMVRASRRPGRPCAERPPQRVADVARRGEQRVQVDAVAQPLAVEQVDEVLGGQVAGRARRVRAAAGPAGRGVEAADAELERRGDVGQRRAARVVEVHRQPLGADAGRQQRADHAAHVGRPGHADRVADAELVDAELQQPLRDAHDGGLADLALVRAAEGGADVAAAPPAALAGRRRPPAGTRRSTRRSLMLMLCAVNGSEAAVKTQTASAPAASARSRPRSFGTSTG